MRNRTKRNQCQVSMLATALPISRRSMYGVLVGLRLEWNASWQSAQSPVSRDGCADATVVADVVGGCECTTATNCATRINAAPKTAIDRLRLKRVELLHGIAIQSRGVLRISTSLYIRVYALYEIRARALARDCSSALEAAQRLPTTLVESNAMAIVFKIRMANTDGLILQIRGSARGWTYPVRQVRALVRMSGRSEYRCC